MNPDNDSNNGSGVAVYGLRPDKQGATTDAGADKGYRKLLLPRRGKNASPEHRSRANRRQNLRPAQTYVDRRTLRVALRR